jgi:DNA polymerase-1
VLDIEWDPADDDALLALGWRGEAYVDPVPQAVLDELADERITKVTFTKADHRWCRLHGIEVNGPHHDVQVMAWMLGEAQDLDLDSVALRFAGIRMDKRLRRVGGRVLFRCDDGTEVPIGHAPLDQLIAYNLRDVQATKDLYRTLVQELADADLLDLFLEEHVPFTDVLGRMEARGVPVDVPATIRLRDEIQGEIDKLVVELRADADLPEAFNLGSNLQLADYLYKKRFKLKGRVPVDEIPDGFDVAKLGRVWAHGHYELAGRGFKVRARTDKGAPSVAGPKLRVHYGEDPWVQKLLELKQRETIVSTFLNVFPEVAVGGRLYGRFNQTGTVTGRLSSSGPNMQNIPARSDLGRKVRELFTLPAGEGHLIHADYSQLEPRLSAHWSQDPVMLDLFRNDEDIYLVTARAVYGRMVERDDVERAHAKTFVLGMSYLAGAKTLAIMLTENGFPTTTDRAEEILRELKRLYRVFFAYADHVVKQSESMGFVPTLMRERRIIPATRGGHWKESSLSPTQAINAQIQGSAADVVQRVMVRAHQQFPQLRLLAQVHDELLWEADEAPPPFTLHRLQKLAERGHGFRLTVPLKFEPKIVGSWAEGK